MKRVQRLVEQAAKGDEPVLITGEPGMAEDRVAREIHRLSSRARATLLEVNCASLPRDFFADRGAGDGRHAPSALDGLTGGTLFLNDIAELSPQLQLSLLERLRRIDPQRGGAEFRLIAATHRDLVHDVQAGAFGEELYYRVNLIHIHVPPLRAHPEDLPDLLQHLLREFGEAEGRPIELPKGLVDRFMSHPWPGNLHEFENAVRRLVALRDPGYVLEELEAQSERSARGPDVELVHAPAPTNGAAPRGHGPAHDESELTVDLKEVGRRASDLAEREAIVDMLARTLGNKKEAALRLRISYKALLYKIHAFGIAKARSDASRIASEQDDSLTRT